MNKPPWHKEVREITREEAYVLINLGAEVGFDDCHKAGCFGWKDRPGYFIDRMDHLDAKAAYQHHFFYVEKPSE